MLSKLKKSILKLSMIFEGDNYCALVKTGPKSSIEENLKKTTGILKEAKAAGETLKEIGVMVAKAAMWLGTTKAALGWIF
jgi:hypothetical protein